MMSYSKGVNSFEKDELGEVHLFLFHHYEDDKSRDFDTRKRLLNSEKKQGLY